MSKQVAMGASQNKSSFLVPKFVQANVITGEYILSSPTANNTKLV